MIILRLLNRFFRSTLRLLCAIGLVLAVYAHAQAGEPWQTWKNTAPANDLIGQIWSVSEGRFIEPEKLALELASSNYVLIGETHDNWDHHRLQAWLISQLALTGKPAIVMEMISIDQSQVLDEYLSKPGSNPAGLGPALGWDASGWPQWSIYQPIAEAFMAAKLSLYPGDPARALLRQVGRQGIGVIDPDEQKQLALDIPLSATLSKALYEEIKLSHCDLLPVSMLTPMTQVQRLRDAILAAAMVDAARENANKAILIAGNGHVRADRAVPWYLARQDASALVSTVMLVEVEGQAASIDELFESYPGGRPAADYYWFTPPAVREDQCEKLRQRFNK